MRANLIVVAPGKYEVVWFRPGSAAKLPEPPVPVIHAIGKALAAAFRKMRAAAEVVRRIGGGRR